MLTDKELGYLADQDFLLTKRQVTGKIIRLLADLEKDLKAVIAGSAYDFPPGCQLQAGKISKGENFRDLPYVILDYPRLFARGAVFAYRTMFWWGNFFSNTLHVSGAGLDYMPSDISITTQPELYVQYEGDPWDHSLGSAMKVDSIETSLFEDQKVAFVKLSQKIPLEEYMNVKDHSINFFRQLFRTPGS